MKKFPPPANASIAITIIITLITVTTLIVGAFGVMNYLSERDLRLAKLREGLRVDADQLATGLSLAVWNIDRVQIDRIIESTMKNRDIYGIVVIAAGRTHIRVRDSQWNIREVHAVFPTRNYLPEQRDVFFSGELIGQAALYGATVFVENDLHALLVSTIISILAFDLLMTLGLYLLLRWSVIDPLKDIERFAVAVSAEKTPPLFAGTMRFRGELAGVRSSIQTMVDLLQSRYQAIQQQVASNELINDLLGRLASASASHIDGQVSAALKEAAIFFHAEHAFLLLLTSDRKAWSLSHDWHFQQTDDFHRRYQEIPIEKFPWNANVLMNDGIVRINVRDDYPPEAVDEIANAEREGVQSQLLIPFRGAGGFVEGAVGLRSYTTIIRWSENDVRVLKILCQAIAHVLDRKRSEERLKISHDKLRALTERLNNIREEEKTHLAHEIHDEFGQVLSAMKMDLAYVRKKLFEIPQPDVRLLGAKIDSLSGIIDQTIVKIRQIAIDLRPDVLDNLGLYEAIRWYAEEFQSRSGIRCTVQLPSAKPALDNELATALFRITQEALTNVARHAGAKNVAISFTKETDSYRLEIADDGKGICAEDMATPTSLGILGMNERVVRFNGSFTITGNPGKGTTVSIAIPINTMPASNPHITTESL